LVFSLFSQEERQNTSSAEARRHNEDGETSSLPGMPRDMLAALFLFFYFVTGLLISL
jgi:hypothetical protein